MLRQLPKQCVDLGFPHREILEKVQQRANFVKGQADDIDQMGDLGDDLQPEPAAAEPARIRPVFGAGPAAINLVSDPHRAAFDQPPYRPDVRQVTSLRRNTLRINGYRVLHLRQFAAGLETPASSLPL